MMTSPAPTTPAAFAHGTNQYFPSPFLPSSFLAALLAVVLAMVLAGCASGPPTPDWQLETKGALERSVSAYLEGNTRVEKVEFDRAKSELSATGRADLMARAELVRCAAHVASLVFEPCAGFERLRQDAPVAERAYADYLAAKLNPRDVALLPAQQRGAATGDAAAISSVVDPLSQLVAAGVALQAGRASPGVVQLAVDTASAQGWRRPLLAWLGVQASLAEKAGDSLEVERIRRRIALAQNLATPAR